MNPGAAPAIFNCPRARFACKKRLRQIAPRQSSTQATAQSAQRHQQFNQIALRLQPNSTFNQPLDQQNTAQEAPETIAVNELSSFFAQYPSSKRAAPSIDPANPKKLPWSTPAPTKRAPAETKTAWNNNLHKDYYAAQSVKLAQAGNSGTIGPLSFTQLPEPTVAPTAADLAETDEVKLTAAIKAQALALGNNPVQIHNWVRNTLQWLPTWGSIQGAEGTLKSLRGNSTDIASLEIALLRAAGIPARYQFGTIDISAEQAMNWVGGVAKPEAALQLLGQGGIANRGLIEGGRFAKVRMEHVWVQAYVNWAPSRGAKDGGFNLTPKQHVNPNGQLNAWVPLDASFKQYKYTQGMDLKTQVPLDANAVLNAAQLGATSNVNYVQNLNQGALQTQLSSYQNQLQAYINSTATGASSTVGDVLGTQSIKTSNHEMLAGTLQYPVVSLGSQVSVLPDALRWKASFALFTSDFDRAGDSPAFQIQKPMSLLAGQRLAFTYEPSAAIDQQLLNAAVASNQTSFSAYLIRMTPKLKLEGVDIAVGPSGLVGQDHFLRVTFTSPWETVPREYKVTSGDVSAIVINTIGTTPIEFNARVAQKDISLSSDNAEYVLEMLHQIGLGWWGQKFAYEDVLSNQMGVIKYNLPSHTRVGAVLRARYFFGIARSASYRGQAMDAKLDYVMVQAKSGVYQAPELLNFMRTIGQIGSFLEGAIFDQAFLSEQQKGVSSVTLLASANRQGIPIYQITQANSGEINNLTIPSEIRQEIADAVAYGRQVTVSRDEVTHFGYRGVGYIIEDPIDGSAAYQIDGGLSGGGSDGPQSVLPFPTMVFTPIIGILLGPTLRQLGARLMVDAAGQMVGVGFFQKYAPAIPVPGPGSAPDLRVAGLIAALLAILSAMQSGLDRKYPKRPPLGLVKYSNSAIAQLNYSTKMIRASGGGTFGGNVVYLALFNDPVVKSSIGGIVGCPPSGTQSLKLAELYQIPVAGGPYTPDDASANVYFEITRVGVYNEKFNFNTSGVTEVTIPEARLIPSFVFGDGLGRLYIGSGAPAIENVQLCY